MGRKVELHSNRDGNQLRKEVYKILLENGKVRTNTLEETIKVKDFPSGTIHTEHITNVSGASIHFIGSFQDSDAYETKKEIVDSNLDLETKGNLVDKVNSVQSSIVELEQATDASVKGGATGISYYFSRLPNARQDAQKHEGEAIPSKMTLNKLKTGCNGNLERFCAVDLHSSQIKSFESDPFWEIDCTYLLLGHAKYTLNEDFENAVVVFADAGAAKKYGPAVKELGLESGFVGKLRDEKGIQREGYQGPQLEGRPTILIDDMIDTGGTLVTAEEIITEEGATSVNAYTGHLIASTVVNRDKETKKVTSINFTEERLRNSNIKVVASNSTPRTKKYYEENNDWFTPFSIAPYVAEAIECAETQENFNNIVLKTKEIVLNGSRTSLEKELNRFFYRPVQNMNQP